MVWREIFNKLNGGLPEEFEGQGNLDFLLQRIREEFGRTWGTSINMKEFELRETEEVMVRQGSLSGMSEDLWVDLRSFLMEAKKGNMVWIEKIFPNRKILRYKAPVDYDSSKKIG